MQASVSASYTFADAVMAACLLSFLMQAAVSPKASSGHEDDSLQPWQLTALQDCAEFNDGNAAEAAERCRGMTAVLTGLLEVCDQRRWTAEQLAGNSWLQGAAQQAISPCPLQL